MRRETYQRGISGIKWGIWNCQKKCFQFDIRWPWHGFIRKLAMTPKSGALSRGSFRPNMLHFRPVLDIGFCTGFDA